MARVEDLGALYLRMCVWVGGLSAAIWFAAGMIGLMTGIGDGDILWKAAGLEVAAFVAASAIFAGLGARRAAVGRGDALGGFILMASGGVMATGFVAAAVDIWIDYGDMAWTMTRLTMTGLGAGAFGFHGAAIGLIGAIGARGWIMALGARFAGGCALFAALFALWSAAGPLSEWFGLIMIGLVLGYGVTGAFCAFHVLTVDLTRFTMEADARIATGVYIAIMLMFVALWIFVLGGTMEAGAARFAIGAGAVCVMMTIGVWFARKLETLAERVAERERRRERRCSSLLSE